MSLQKDLEDFIVRLKKGTPKNDYKKQLALLLEDNTDTNEQKQNTR